MSSNDVGTAPPSRRRLNTWGEIASYLGVSIRTTQLREQKDGLPVYRNGNRVFAYSDELDSWQISREKPPQAQSLNVQPAEAPVFVPPTMEARGSRLARIGWIVGILGGSLLVGVTSWLIFSNRFSSTAEPRYLPDVVESRLFVRASAEAGSFRVVPVPDTPSQMAVSPDGNEVYLSADGIPRLTVLNTSSWQVHVVELPTALGAIRPARSGHSVLLGSLMDGFFIYDRQSGKIVEQVRTGGPVSDIVTSPKTGDFYVAMMHRGVRRFRPKDHSLEQITREGCPYFLDIDPQSRILLVSYQCGGPTGRDGHDAIELIDLPSEESITTFAGPPLVGGPHRFSPDGRVAWLNGWDACRTASYDHEGCPFVPSDVLHVFRIADGRPIKTLAFPPGRGGQPYFFPTGSRVFLDQGMSVVETSQYNPVEVFKLPEQSKAVLAPDGRRAYVARQNLKDLVVIEAEGDGCSKLGPGAIHLMTGDGTSYDSVENAYVSPPLRFQPGHVGQAFELDGNQKSIIRSSSGFKFSHGDSTMALYVKPAILGRERTLLEWGNANGWQLALTRDNKIQMRFLRSDKDPISLESSLPLPSNKWTHLAVTKAGESHSLFVNGTKATTAQGVFHSSELLHYRLGWSSSTDAAFVGLIDEITIWARALPETEIRALYEKRTKTPCKM